MRRPDEEAQMGRPIRGIVRQIGLGGETGGRTGWKDEALSGGKKNIKHGAEMQHISL